MLSTKAQFYKVNLMANDKSLPSAIETPEWDNGTMDLKKEKVELEGKIKDLREETVELQFPALCH